MPMVQVELTEAQLAAAKLQAGADHDYDVGKYLAALPIDHARIVQDLEDEMAAALRLMVETHLVRSHYAALLLRMLGGKDQVIAALLARVKAGVRPSEPEMLELEGRNDAAMMAGVAELLGEPSVSERAARERVTKRMVALLKGLR